MIKARPRFAPALLAAALAVPLCAMQPAPPLLPDPNQPNRPVIIDPGHGGDDQGAVVRGLREKDLALTFAKKLRARLAKNDGLPVVLTRESDHYVTLDGRIIDSVDKNASMFVSLHFNKIKGKKAAGTVVYSYGRETRRKWRGNSHPSVPPMPAPPGVQAKNSDSLARIFSRTMRGDGFRAQIRKADYYVLKNPAAPSVLIELGYLNNPAEAARLKNSAYQDKMVESLAKAIEEYTAERSMRTVVTKL